MQKNEGLIKKKISSINRQLNSLAKGFPARGAGIGFRAGLVKKHNLLVDKYNLLSRMVYLSEFANRRLNKLEGKRKDQHFEDRSWWPKQSSFISRQFDMSEEIKNIKKQIEAISAKLN